MALAGGAMIELVSSTSQDKSSKGSGLIICGDENVKVFSFGMFEDGITKGDEMTLAKVNT